jgi:membrane protein
LGRFLGLAGTDADFQNNPANLLIFPKHGSNNPANPHHPLIRGSLFVSHPQKQTGMKIKITPKGLWQVLKDSFSGFSEDKVTKLSASLAYYTVFSLGPMLIVIIFLCSIFLGREAIEGTIYNQIKGFVGADAAAQVQDIIKSASIGGKGKVAAIIGVITLLIGATTVFAEIQDSINSIWGLKAKPKLGIMKLIKTRLLSFGVIGSLGFLLLVSLAATALVEGIGDRLKDMFPDITVVVFYIINLILTLTVVTLLFAVIFKVLPDAKIKWKDVWAGSIATALLFIIGKFAISFYISKSDVGSTYGTAGSLVVLLVWIYYSSIILYFGAEFTKAYAVKYATAIQPNEYAVVTKKVEVEDGKAPIQEQEKKQKEENSKSEEQPKSTEGNKRKEPHKKAEPHQPKVIQPWLKKPVREKQYRFKPEEIKYEDVKKESIKPAGIVTLVGGLLLYFINTAANEGSDAKKLSGIKED